MTLEDFKTLKGEDTIKALREIIKSEPKMEDSDIKDFFEGIVK